jgi:hypothetical protein
MDAAWERHVMCESALRERDVATSVLFLQSLLLQPHNLEDYHMVIRRYLFTFP